MTIQEILDKLGPGERGVYIGKGYTVAQLREDLEAMRTDWRVDRPCPSCTQAGSHLPWCRHADLTFTD